jgi:ABC-type branched-subunit amino acid transport system permease subunit
VVVGFLIVFRALQLSHVGWAFRGLRDDETAAELAGVDVARYRIYAATVGSAMIGRPVRSVQLGFVSPDTYAFSPWTFASSCSWRSAASARCSAR